MRWPEARRQGPARRSNARPAARKAARPRSRKWPSAITITARNGRRRQERGRNEGRAQDHPGDRHHCRRVEDPQGADRAAGRRRRRGAGGLRRLQTGRRGAEKDQMTVVAIIVALVLGFLAFRFVTGMIKIGLIAIIALAIIYFLARGGGL